MSAQVEVVLHEFVEERPPDTASRKRRQSLVNSPAWLDARLDEILEALPERDLSLFEVGLYCIITHLPFHNPMNLDAMLRLLAFEKDLGQRPSARDTPYEFDQTP